MSGTLSEASATTEPEGGRYAEKHFYRSRTDVRGGVLLSHNGSTG